MMDEDEVLDEFTCVTCRVRFGHAKGCEDDPHQ